MSLICVYRGPFQLADYIGLDTIHSIITGWTQAHPHEKAFFMPICLDNMVKKGTLGRKTVSILYVYGTEYSISRVSIAF